MAFVADFGTQNFNLKTKFDMEHKTSINHENGNDANRLLAAVVSQCKDVPDKPIMEFLLKHKGHWCNWYFEDNRDVRNAMPKNLASEKLILAKMRQLMKRGLVDGCSCGCRGDFEITPKGEEWLSLQ